MCSNCACFLLDNVITGVETWAFEYDSVTNRPSTELHITAFPKQKEEKMNKSKVVLVLCLFRRLCVDHKEFVPSE